VKHDDQTITALQRVVLSSALSSADALSAIRGVIEDGHFPDRTMRRVWRAIIEVADAGETLSDVAVADRLRGQIENAYSVVADIATTEAHRGPVSARHHATLLRQHAADRALSTHLRAAIDKEIDPAALAARVREITERWAAHVAAPADERTGLREVLEDALAAEERGDVESVVSLRDWPRTDTLLGGMRGGEIIVVAGRPGHGKSAWAGSAALQVAGAGVPVQFFSLEMSARDVALRMARSLARSTLQNAGELRQAVAGMERLPLEIVDSCCGSVDGILARITQAHRAGRCGLAVVDYLQLLNDGGGENRTQEVTRITRRLKVVARTLNIPVVLLSQLSRGIETRRDSTPVLSDLRESGSIEQDADKVLFISRPGSYGSGDPAEASVIVAKNRCGCVGKVKMSFVGEIYTFLEVDDG